MLGNIVNTTAIVIGSIIGMLFRGKIANRFNDSIMKGVGLGVLLIGILNALEVENMILVLISLALGTLIGEAIHIEKKLENLGTYIQGKTKAKGDGITRSFVTSSLLFCVGSMAIIGSLESGLQGNHQTLFAKAILDGISSIIFTSSIGFGVIFSAIPVFIYQGAIVLAANFLKPYLITTVIANMTAVGGLLIIGLGINMLELGKIKVGNMLPSIFIPLIYHTILEMITIYFL